jgi:glycosyltransferase involved in cell wall biosynthesis
VVNLRSPERLGLSAVLLRALAAAKPVITSAIDEWQIFPDGTCLWVEQGDKELAKFLEHLMTLADSKSLRDQYGSAARRWFLENATISHMVAAYMDQADSLRDSHSRNSSVSDPVARQAE